MAKELAPDVRVNAIAQGAICWPEHENSLSAAQQQQIITEIALQRSGDVNDIAQAVYFLLNSDYVTGQTITVDGGRCL